MRHQPAGVRPPNGGRMGKSPFTMLSHQRSAVNDLPIPLLLCAKFEVCLDLLLCCGTKGLPSATYCRHSFPNLPMFMHCLSCSMCPVAASCETPLRAYLTTIVLQQLQRGLDLSLLSQGKRTVWTCMHVALVHECHCKVLK